MSMQVESHHQAEQQEKRSNEVLPPKHEAAAPKSESGLSVLLKVGLLVAVPAVVFALIQVLIN